ncbi:integral membrane protein DUF92-domain-containing protein [Peziza echinospora]|nr:integral membrane protein DUF92-domain-containing protein [Peziza echinospora]
MNLLISTPLILLLIHRAHTRNSLTPAAILAATLTALIHASHASALPFTLLLTFYILGTGATKVKRAEKERLCVSSEGGHFTPGVGEGRGVRQVLANSAWASLCVLAGRAVVGCGVLEKYLGVSSSAGSEWVGRVVLVGVICNYAATTADTLSSELGILSPTPPHFILHPTTPCPPGTNGGVTPLGLLSGLLGSLSIALIAVFAPWDNENSLFPTTTTTTPLSAKLTALAYFTVIGLLGSLVDSVLGEVLQKSVVDVKTGKIVENHFGGEVIVGDGKDGKGSRRVVGGGRGWLDNNGVNAVMAGGMTGVGVAGWVWLGL